jgi:DNA-binding beta-propeller fold protein YncE
MTRLLFIRWIAVVSLSNVALATEMPDFSQYKGLPVSLIVDGEEVIAADYNGLILYTKDGIKDVPVESNGFHLNPAGIAFDQSTRELFIANYTANNILIGKREATGEIKIVREIRDDRTISPEGIAYSNDLVAVANYNGNNVQIFSRSMASGERALCDMSVEAAHGITFAGEYVIATSLGEHKIIKIDPRSCSKVTEIEGFGWGDGQFLWPTGLVADELGRVWVSDAHTGYITIWQQWPQSIQYALWHCLQERICLGCVDV